MSISPEVFFIVGFIGILIFIPTVFIVSRFVKRPIYRFITSFAISFLLSPIVYVGFIFLWIWSATFYPQYSFDHDKWMTASDTRYEMTADLIKSNLLIGKSKTEVKEILGDNNNEMSSDDWSYPIGFEPELLNIDPSFINIYFENDKVVKVEQYHS